ncbi:MAG TPA: hypothetical protein VMV68_00095 [Spirochaetia bacterium]|nr:hypothetical protein [Spirochaetia bacterium]
MSARSTHPDRIEPLLPPTQRFLWGTTLLVLFLFQHLLPVKLLLVLLFGGLGILAGKRIRWSYFLLLAASITLFNLLTPYGRVLFSLGPLDVTSGALTDGLMKGITIVGLVFVSLFSVSRRLVLPGRFGAFLGRSFYYFERLYGERKRVRRTHIIEDIDAILECASAIEAEDDQPGERIERRPVAGILVAALVVVVVAGTLFIPARLLPSF